MLCDCDEVLLEERVIAASDKTGQDALVLVSVALEMFVRPCGCSSSYFDKDVINVR